MGKNKINNIRINNKFRSFLFAGILTASAIYLSSSAFAGEPGSFYIKGGFGYSMNPSIKIKTSTDSTDSANTKYNNETDFTSMNDKRFGGALGYYASEDIKTEASFSYFKNKKTDVHTIDFKSIDALLAGYYIFTTNSFFAPYIHAGVGLAKNDTTLTIASSGIYDAEGKKIDIISGTIKAKTDYKLQYNVGFGFDINLSKHITLGAKYSLGNGIGQKINDYAIGTGDTAQNLKLETKSDFSNTITADLAFVF